MPPNSQQHIAKNLVTLSMLFFLLYCAIVGSRPSASKRLRSQVSIQNSFAMQIA